MKLEHGSILLFAANAYLSAVAAELSAASNLYLCEFGGMTQFPVRLKKSRGELAPVVRHLKVVVGPGAYCFIRSGNGGR